jgi:hypothetical protein
MVRVAFKAAQQKQSPALVKPSARETSQIFRQTVEASANISFLLN